MSALDRPVRVPVDARAPGSPSYRNVRPSNVLAALDDEQREALAVLISQWVGTDCGPRGSLMSAATIPRADRPVNDYIDSYVWHHEGWENAGEHSVQTARRTTRGQAASLFAHYDHDGDITQVSVWKRWVRPMTFADVWDFCGAERWEDRYRDEHGIDSRKVGGVWLDFDVDTNEPVSFEVPALPPDDWEPDPEGDPVWQFVHRSHPEAVPVWICGERGTPAPQNPTKTHEGESGN